MSELIERLQKAKVAWQDTTESPYIYATSFAGKQIRLRLNDFPDEPLYTLWVDDEVADFDEFPQSWTLPRHRK